MAKPNDTSKLVAMNAARRFDNDKVFVENSSYPRHRLKERILKENMIEYKCSGCSIGPEWNGSKLVLQLEHKNGKNDDHRLDNLDFLCPNCHSQTSTYAARNRKNPSRSPKPYIDKNGYQRNVGEALK